MIKIKDTPLIAFFFLASSTLAAQQKAGDFNHFTPRFEVFTLPGGTLGNSVQGIVQDSAGFLWFASQEGLHRYDGQNFFTYRHDPFNPNSLASDYIEYIFLDSKGILWLAHYSDGGLTAFDPAKEIFTRYRHDPANPETLSSNTTSVVAEDRQGYIWVGGQSGLDRLDPETGKFKRFHHDPAQPGSLSYDQVRALYVDKQGTLWVGTGFPFDTKNPAGGLNRYDPKTETFTRYLHDQNNPNTLVNNKIRALLEDSKGKGSTFYFTLPMASVPVESDLEAPVLLKNAEAQVFLSSPDESPVPIESHNSSLIAHRSISILVVDDEPVNQQVLKNHLHTAHYHITPALNGEEALLALESGRTFDLVLLDLMMPRMSGYEVCQKIREKYLPSELPVIMVTAKNQVQDLVQGLNTGANDYLSKPFSKEEFLARVKTQLNLHHINEATSKFVPNEFLRSLGRENIAEVLLGDHVEREVTVLFADIRDYTTLSESMMPEENFNFVKAFNGRMGPVIQQHKGFVNQYLGDGIMAIFPENPADALQASVAMQIELAAYNEYRATKGRKPIRVGLGMHTGSLIMGIIGDEHRLDAATISDAVNTASRLESLTKYYGANIIISKDSLDKIGRTGNMGTDDAVSDLRSNAFHVRYLGKVQVKGKHIPVHVYECFNGDKPTVIQKKLATLEAFAAGIQHYLDKQFAAAAAAFEAVLQQHPEDVTARLFLGKTEHFITHGAPEEWTGVEMMEGK